MSVCCRGFVTFILLFVASMSRSDYGISQTTRPTGLCIIYDVYNNLVLMAKIS